MTDTEKTEGLIYKLLEALGEDPQREGLLETPKRVANMYKHIFGGYGKDPAEVFKVFDAEKYSGIVTVKDIEYYSFCEHHLLPFFGKVSIAYIPDGKVVGLSKIPRLVEIYARRLQLQERLTQEINDAIVKYLKPKGALTYIESKHMCIQMRGIQKQGTKVSTMSCSGEFEKNCDLRRQVITDLKS